MVGKRAQSQVEKPAENKGDSDEPRLPSVEYVHTPEVPGFLNAINASLIVTTYQAQRILAFSLNELGRLSMLMRIFERPTGLWLSHEKMCLISKSQTWLFESTPDIWDETGTRLPYDLCYVPRRSYVTGDIAGHEVDMVGGEPLIVNTRFSCLCRLSDRYSFEPVWKPSFITELVAEDRCHLNGLASDGVQPRYVTALGETDTAQGWRPTKKDGGILIDVQSGEVLCRGLSMPHSPRIYGGRLWVLESGMGELQVVDPKSGVRETVARFPGYTRGLSFFDRFAFVGICKIRESNLFGGLRVTEMYPEPLCAIYIVDLVTGRHVGYIKFTRGIEELFDIRILPGVRRPHIVGFEEDTVQGLYVLPPNLNSATKPVA